MGTDHSLVTQQKRDRNELAAPKLHPAKKRRLQRRIEEGTTMDSSTEDRQLVIVTKKAVAVITDKPLALTSQIEQGQQSRFSEEEVMTFKDLPTEAYELGVILKYNMAYQLIDFPACLQVVAATRMAQDHAEQQMVEQTLDNELESDEEPKLQKIRRKHITVKVSV